MTPTLSSETAGILTALAPHEVLHGDDPDEAEVKVGEIIAPHHLRLLNGSDGFSVQQFACQMGAVTVGVLRYGTEVEIRAPGSAACFCVQLPLTGRVEVACGGERVVSNAVVASVPAPSEPLRMRWGPGATQLIISVDRRAVEQHLVGLLNGAMHEPLRPQLPLYFTGSHRSMWSSTIGLLVAEAALHPDRWPDGSPASEARRSAISDLVINNLLLGQPNNYSQAMLGPGPAVSSPQVRRTLDYVSEHLRDPLPLSRLAQVAGTSPRSLQAAFAREFGKPPSVVVREMRLDRVRAELRRAEPDGPVGVSQIALEWGFAHCGRFARYYRDRFAELPSETLRGS